MARTKGSFTLGGTLEVEADAPADARLQVKTIADLTASGSFPYKYVGMIVSVEATQEAYMLIGSDPTDSNNWQLQGQSSGTTDYTDLENKPSINDVTLSGNKDTSDLGLQDTIQYSTMPTASEDLEGAVYQYLGATTSTYTHGHWYECVSDGEDPATYSWVEAPNYEEMEDSDMDDVVTPLPSTQRGYHKYSTEEQVVGEWIDGKPIFEKTFSITLPNCVTAGSPVWDTDSISLDFTIDVLISRNGYFKVGNNVMSIPYVHQQEDKSITMVDARASIQNGTQTISYYNSNTGWNGAMGRITIQYTKTTA